VAGFRALSVEERFHKEFLSIPRVEQKKIVRALADLQRDPMHSSIPLKGVAGVFRRRVDAYRILFATSASWIHVYSVQHRRSVYQGDLATPAYAPPKDVPDWPSVASDADDESSDQPLAAAEDPPLLDWDVVAKVVLSRDAEDLYGLIDMGLPEPLFDELFEQLTKQPKERVGPRNVHLVRERVIDEFYGRYLLLSPTIRRLELTIVTPWLTPWDGVRSSYSAFVESLTKFPVATTLITRPPLIPQHRKCVDELSQLRHVEVIFLEDLHAKFFICDIPPVPFALIGSANTTAQSFLNFEVGVFIRGAAEAEAIIRDLQALTIELRVAGKRTSRRAQA
jgi:mRNA-degrading endonuclease RelE of RelBE toxin-antitoxin system